ncbi:FG-GAP-like repeat-containing protein, partial [bacterium]|nr:FG-GAP-like repeat-containing protein [bacterium]
MDADGDPDLFVCNDFESPDRIWINDGTGYFQAISKLAMRNISWATMGIDFSDIDRDGDLDFFLLDMLSTDPKRRKTQRENMIPLPHSVGAIDNRPQNSRNTLFLNRGDSTYAEVAQFSGLQASEWSWTPLFLDVDLDGYEDLIVATGHFYDALDLDALEQSRRTRYHKLEAWRARVLGFPELKTTNFAFRNRGNLKFSEISQEWGFTALDISHGLASADLDNDGDLDLVMNRLNDEAAIYRNQTTASRIAVRLRGLAPNTQGIGAKIQVFGGPVPQSKEVLGGGSYLSSSDPVFAFATGNADRLAIRVIWRNGKLSVIENAQPNRIYEIYESDAVPVEESDQREMPISQPYFKDTSELIDHLHHDNEYDDFRYQPLLPKKLSQLGPGVTWFDLDDDNDEDLLIGSGQGGRMACFRNDGEGGFQLIDDRLLNQQTSRDQTTVLGWKTSQGIPSLVAGFSSLENSTSADWTIDLYEIVEGTTKLRRRFGEENLSVGPMSMADYDSDGDLDLFVGGRAIPKRYPEPASSRLYRNNAGQFTPDSANSASFKNLGLVSGVVFGDIDGDADADLVLAIEWGPVMIFRNEGGTFVDVTSDLGLSNYLGWWQGVTTGDLDEDGRLDIIATNWGLNSPYEGHYDQASPLRVYYDDFDNNGTLDMVEAFFVAQIQDYTPRRNFEQMSRAMPYLQRRITTHKAFSEASVQEVVGFKAKQAGLLEANTLAHSVFFNRGNRFERVQLPDEAQFAPGFYCGVADFDGDGHDDLFIAQNFFSLETGASRLDAGRGLWMKGDGTGALTAVPGHISGIKVYGEQRGAGLCDFDRDGRVDLAVSQNGAKTKLYRNVGGRPGLRVRLLGPPGNPNGVGATIRIVYENSYGPARYVHLGSGYWSQDSTVQILGLQNTAKGLWIRWPDGQISNVTLPIGARHVTIDHNGRVTVNASDEANHPGDDIN